MIYIHPTIKALIFDCDGTIADNMHIHNNAWKVIAKKYNINISSQELSKYNGIPTINVLRKLSKHIKFNIELKTIVQEKENIAYQKIHQSIPIQPIIKIIKQYHNKIPMVVLSGGTLDNVNKTLSMFKIKNLFTWIITADNNHPTKETPLAFIKIAQKLKVDTKLCHVFEDGRQGLINAIKANMVITDMRTLCP